MKIQHLLAVGLMTACTTTAFAQSATLYGLIDSGIEHINNIGDEKKSTVRMPTNSASLPSRWGIRGTEDLGGGLKSMFVIESGFAPNTGGSNQGGRLFGRQAHVGLSGPWGEIKLGRQYSMLYMALLPVDVLGGNIYGSGNLDFYLPNARIDNSISYLGRFYGLTAGAMYSRDSNQFGALPCGLVDGPAGRGCRHSSFLLQYERDGFGLVTAYDVSRGSMPLSVRNDLTDKRLYLAGFGQLAKTKFSLAWLHRVNDASANEESDLIFAGVSHEVSPAWTLAASVARLKYRDSPDHAILYAARASYALSKRTAAYVTAGHINNSGNLDFSVSGGSVTGTNPAAGGSQTGTMIGLRHFF